MTLCPWGTLDLLQGAYFYHPLSERPYFLGPGQDIPAPAFNPQHKTTSCGSRKDFAAGSSQRFPICLANHPAKLGSLGLLCGWGFSSCFLHCL